jgi:GTP-binding protein HflX
LVRENYETKPEIQKVILAAVEKQKDADTIDYTLEEFQNLAEANNLEVVGIITQKLDRPVSGTYFGSGKIEELSELVAATDATLVVSNDDLTATQIRNLEKLIGHGIRVVDRTALILDIFATRAQTKVAKLQVRLAQKQYQLPRLHTSLANELDQQGGAGGGSFTSRGAGETKLELSRRVIEDQIIRIKRELKDVIEASGTQRKQRDASGLPRVALVGYTNAGKSTWMNKMIENYGVESENDDKTVFEKDMLFATLDSTVRAIKLPNKRQILLSDTVGFVSNLPHDLVASFHSTLEEAINADLLVQVVDVSDPHYKEMMDTTEQTLREIGADQVPMVVIYNKADKTEMSYPDRNGNTLTASARDEKSVLAFVELITQELFGKIVEVELLIPFDRGDIVSEINSKYNVLSTEYLENGTQLKVSLLPEEALKYNQFEQK